MFHTYQTKSEIQKIIIDTMVCLGRPATEEEVAAWIWNRMLIDGIKSGVFKTVELEMRGMKAAQMLRRVNTRDSGVGPFYVIHDLLTAIAILAD